MPVPGLFAHPMRPNLLDTRPPLATLMVATCNVLNLANPGRVFYDNQDPYSQAEFERKLNWLGTGFARSTPSC